MISIKKPAKRKALTVRVKEEDFETIEKILNKEKCTWVNLIDTLLDLFITETKQTEHKKLKVK